jgi:hypothetical protein
LGSSSARYRQIDWHRPDRPVVEQSRVRIFRHRPPERRALRGRIQVIDLIGQTGSNSFFMTVIGRTLRSDTMRFLGFALMALGLTGICYFWEFQHHVFHSPATFLKLVMVGVSSVVGGIGMKMAFARHER